MYFWEIHGGGGIGWGGGGIGTVILEQKAIQYLCAALPFPPSPPTLQPAHWREFHNISHITYCFCLKEKTQLYKLC